jgi:hypothetical protein
MQWTSAHYKPVPLDLTKQFNDEDEEEEMMMLVLIF